MKKTRIILSIIVIVLVATFVMTSSKYLGNMSYDSLLEIVEQDSTVFSENDIPDQVLDHLAHNRVVVAGEYHNITEHTSFLYQLSTSLHKDHSFDKLLVETPQAFSWIFEDYSTGLLPKVDETVKETFWLHIADAEKIRDYNSPLPVNSRLQVCTIDMNHSPYYFVRSLQYMEEFINNSQPLIELTSYLETNITDNDLYINRINEFRNDLLANSAEYVDKLGTKWYDRVVDMIDVEIYSNTCRQYMAAGKTTQRYVEREELIKKLVDEHLRTTNGKVLINVGANHAQKFPARGTKQEWIAEYLACNSPYAKGETYSLLVIPAKGTIESSNGEKGVDLTNGIIRNDLFRVITEYAGQNRAFLSFEDERLAEEKILLNFHYDRQTLSPKDLYDGVVVLPTGTYVNPMQH